MLLIRCPWCGERDHTEFTYGGDATVTRPAADAPDHDWVQYVYLRDNPRGPHQEYWHHVQGCRQWLRVTRDTLTHEITEVAPANASSSSLGRGSSQ
jgi:heterotetrameric sarcosine oxidase delta subunit